MNACLGLRGRCVIGARRAIMGRIVRLCVTRMTLATGAGDVMRTGAACVRTTLQGLAARSALMGHLIPNATFHAIIGQIVLIMGDAREMARVPAGRDSLEATVADARKVSLEKSVVCVARARIMGAVPRKRVHVNVMVDGGVGSVTNARQATRGTSVKRSAIMGRVATSRGVAESKDCANVTGSIRVRTAQNARPDSTGGHVMCSARGMRLARVKGSAREKGRARALKGQRGNPARTVLSGISVIPVMRGAMRPRLATGEGGARRPGFVSAMKAGRAQVASTVQGLHPSTPKTGLPARSQTPSSGTHVQ